jgi:prephenate dehydratase
MTPIIAFQGVPGAYSEEAVRQHFGESAKTLPCANFEGLFTSIEEGLANLALLPVENSLAGTVATSYELLTEHDMRIQAEVVLRVRHMLLAAPGTPITAIKRAKSHPQALAQCAGYLARRGIESIVHFDTAGSARDLAAQPEAETAAIASALAAQLYGLAVLDAGIEDQPFNYTRFFAIGLDTGATQTPDPGQAYKTSVVFAVHNQPGALHDAIGEFAKRGINLTKIESKPRRNKPWQYYFYLDFDGHLSDAKCEAAMVGLVRRAAMVKLLGSYPVAPLMPAEKNNP